MQYLILECAVRALLIAVCTGVVLLILRVKTARVRHAVWASVVVLMLALPVWTAWGPRAVMRVPIQAKAPTMSRPAAPAVAISGQPMPEEFRAETPTPPARSLPWTWRSSLAALYLLGLCALLARLATGTVRAHMLVRRVAHREGRLTSDSCAVPVTVGWLRPAVILPECWQQWPSEQLDAVLAHEEEHARRHDPLVQWLALLNRAVFWFHPLAWWLERRIAALAEEACDAAVLERGHDPFQYSEYLLQIARVVQQSGARVGAVGMAMPGSSLPQRIRQMLEAGPAPRISAARMACVAVACAAVSMVFTAGAVGYAPAKAPAPAPAVSSPTPAPAERPQVLVAQAQATPARPSPPAAEPAPARGSLSGTVEDPSGGRVPNCAVTARNRSGGSVADAVSDLAGNYKFPSLPPNHYSIEFKAGGFALRTMYVEIAPGKPARLDVTLDLGQITESLTVTAQKPAAAAPAAPSAGKPATAPDRIPVGGNVQPARLIFGPRPAYPPELKEQGLEGTVVIRTVVSREGRTLNPRVLNADEVDPRMAQAALDTLSKWRYKPSLLNGNPVEITTTINVEFRLEN
jgi:TonB family protein